MKITVLFLFLCLSVSGFSQDNYMAWLGAGAKGKFVKKLGWDAEFNARIGERGVETFFPQAGISYKLKKWIKPSLEYRFIVDKNTIGNYKSSHRLNINLNFEKSWGDLSLDARVRYQYAFDRINTATYDADFDQAIRLKPGVSYTLNNTPFTPGASCEFFYDPKYGPKGPGFTKLRFAIGSKIKLSKANSLSVKYQIDKKLKSYSSGLRHVLILSYTYKL